MKTKKENRLKQQGKVIWFTGVSGSGKTALAKNLHDKLFMKGYFPVMLDGDDMRTSICNNLAYTIADRYENTRRVAEIARILINNGIIAICSLISPTQEIRQLAKKIIGNNNYLEVFVNAPLNECENRDPKGLYKKARKGLIKYFTGINSPYEPPVSPNIEVNTSLNGIDQCVENILKIIIPEIEYKYE